MPVEAQPLALRRLRDNDPHLRAVAIRCLTDLPAKELVRQIAPRLEDKVRLVRIEAANALAIVPPDNLKLKQLKAYASASDELRASYRVNSDLAGSHLMLGVLAERSGKLQEAAQEYRTAIHVQPDVAGPRSNLAQLMERLRDPQAAARYRAEELPLLRRDAELAPQHASTQYRYGLSLYLAGQSEAAIPLLQRACELEPDNADYLLALALLHERLQNWDAALQGIQAVRRLRPNDAGLAELEARLEQQQRQP